jgi:pyrroloquinoline quinone biosynthesis protein B
MLVRVLGSAAGGGFPQWNCGCPNCVGVRNGSLRAKARSQESVAISADGDDWFLLNASPEVRSQLESFPKLHPKGLRDTPIAGIVITSGDLDHCLGLLSLRESQPLTVYATERVRQSFAVDNRLYRTLERFPGQVTWKPLCLEEELVLTGRNGADTALRLTPYSVPGKPPLHVTGVATHVEDNVALRVLDQSTGGVLAYASSVRSYAPALERAAENANALFFDGTFFSNEELVELGASDRRAEDMAHWPIGGTEGSLHFLQRLRVGRRIYIHINNSNPILIEDSPERHRVGAAGVEVAEDGLELVL